jgi:hypothetical protein
MAIPMAMPAPMLPIATPIPTPIAVPIAIPAPTDFIWMVSNRFCGGHASPVCSNGSISGQRAYKRFGDLVWLLTGAEAENSIRRTPPDNSGCQWNQAQPAPNRLRPDEYQAYYAQSRNDANNAFDIVNILFHGISEDCNVTRYFSAC